MKEDNSIDLALGDELARKRFLSSIPDSIKQAYDNDVVNALSKRFGIEDQSLLQNHLYLTGHIYQWRKGLKRPSRTDIRAELNSISEKAKGLTKQLSRLGSDVRDCFDDAGTLTLQQCLIELGQKTEDRPIYRVLDLSPEIEIYP